MKTKLVIVFACIGLAMVVPIWGTLRAQEDSASQIILTSPDPAHTVQFQVLGEDDTPVAADFTNRLELEIDPQGDPPLVYVSVYNTGWSEGVIGLSSPVLDEDAAYVALEIDADGAPLAGGLAFECVHDAELGDEGGITLPLLIAQARRFGIFQLVDDGGLVFEGWTNQREDNQVTQVAVTYNVDPTPVLNLHLDVHIVATAVAPPAEPATGASPEDASGEGWGACGSCDTCGYPAEQCVLSPDGACIWDPGRCSGQTGAVGDLPEGCYRLTIIIDGGHGSVAVSPTPNCGAGYRWGTLVFMVAEAWGDWEVFGWITDCWQGESGIGGSTNQVVMNFDCTVRVQFYKP